MSVSLFVSQPQKGPLLGIENEILNFSSVGDNVVIAAVPGRKIRIHKLFIVGASSSNIRFWSGVSTENVPKSGLMPFRGNFGLAFDGEEFPLETDSGKAFVISSSNGIQCGA